MACPTRSTPKERQAELNVHDRCIVDGLRGLVSQRDEMAITVVDLVSDATAVLGEKGFEESVQLQTVRERARRCQQTA